MVVPITTRTPEVGLAAQRRLVPGTPVVVVGRVSAWTWTPPGGGAERIVTEIVADQVTAMRSVSIPEGFTILELRHPTPFIGGGRPSL
jgi:hypothetical protein